MIKRQFKNHMLFELEDTEKLSNLGLKVAYRQDDGILALRKIYKNGKLEIICDTEGYKKIEPGDGMTKRQIAGFFKALAALLFVCEESAFLDHTYIGVSEDMIFAGETTGKYHFAMIPVDGDDYNVQCRRWDENMKTLTGSIFMAGTTISPLFLEFKEGIENTNNVAAFIKDNAYKLEAEDEPYSDHMECLELSYQGIYGAFSFYICKDEFVIGKAPDCDGVIPMNPTVSRHHCTIRRNGNLWTVADMGSSNGTCINGTPLTADKIGVLDNDSYIRISDMDFTCKYA